MPSKLVITAGCRSGTKYTATVLHKSGIMARHECVYTEDGLKPWANFLVEVSCFAPAFREDLKDKVIWHQTRHPLNQIASNWSHWEHLLKDVFKKDRRSLFDQIDHIVAPMLHRHRDPFEKAVAYYVLWNDIIETLKPTKRYRVEDVNIDFVLEVADTVGVKVLNERVKRALDEVPNNFNSLPDYCRRKEFKVTPEQATSTPLGKLLEQMAKEYGYELAETVTASR